MTTRFIGVKEFRKNLVKFTKGTRKKNERLVILRKNEPIFEVRSLSKKDATLDALVRGIQEAKEDVKAGRVFSLAEVETMLGL